MLCFGVGLLSIVNVIFFQIYIESLYETQFLLHWIHIRNMSVIVYLSMHRFINSKW